MTRYTCMYMINISLLDRDDWLVCILFSVRFRIFYSYVEVTITNVLHGRYGVKLYPLPVRAAKFRSMLAAYVLKKWRVRYLAALPCRVILPRYLATLPCLITLPRYLAALPCRVTLPRYLASLPSHVTLPRYLAALPCRVTLLRYLAPLPCHVCRDTGARQCDIRN